VFEWVNTEKSKICTLVTLQCFKLVLISCPHFETSLQWSLVVFTLIVSQTDILIVVVSESLLIFNFFCVIFPSKIVFHVRCLTYSSQESCEYRKFCTWKFSHERCWRFESSSFFIVKSYEMYARDISDLFIASCLSFSKTLWDTEKNLWGIIRACVFYFANIFHLKQLMLRRKCIRMYTYAFI